MKKWIFLLALAGLTYGGYSLWKKGQNHNGSSGTDSRPNSAVVELRDISFAVNAAGEIGPAEQVSVRPEINGLIEELPVDIGDRVKKGDLLFKLNDKELQQQKASNLTDVQKANLELEKAERDHKRSKRLLDDKLISQELYDDTKTAFDLAKNALDRANKDLAITEERITKTVVSAPFGCTILTRPVSIGQAVSGSGGFNSGTEVLTIADLNSLVINAQVNQADVPRLKPNEVVEVTIEAVAGLRLHGSVERISPQATIKNNIKGFAARILLKNDDPRVRPGMTANVKIPVASAENVTAVPLAAVFTEKQGDSDQRERFVFIQQGETFEKRNVKVGVSDYFYAEIQDGLKEGEVVALEMPNEERGKKVQQAATQRSKNRQEKSANLQPATSIASARTNSTGQPTAGSDQIGTSGSTRSGSSVGSKNPVTR